MFKYVDRYAGVKANQNASVADYALASQGKDGKARMGHTDRVSTGAELVRFIGWRHMSPDDRKALLPQICLSVLVDHWYGDLKDGKGRSNMDNAERLLALYAAAPDDSRASMEEAWKQYKAGADPRTPVAAPAPAALTAEAILAALASSPALLQALQSLQQVQQVQQAVQPQETLATTKAKAAAAYRAAKTARENG